MLDWVLEKSYRKTPWSSWENPWFPRRFSIIYDFPQVFQSIDPTRININRVAKHRTCPAGADSIAKPVSQPTPAAQVYRTVGCSWWSKFHKNSLYKFFFVSKVGNTGSQDFTFKRIHRQTFFVWRVCLYSGFSYLAEKLGIFLNFGKVMLEKQWYSVYF